MVVADILNSVYGYSAAALDLTKRLGVEILKGAGRVREQAPLKLPEDLQNLDVAKLVKTGHPSVRLAAVCGAAAVILGAYGAHKLPKEEDFEERKYLYDIANRYHFFHTLALIGTPMCTSPKKAAAFIIIGMLLFSGTSYYQALTGSKRFSKLTPVGGLCFVLGWLTMIL